MKDKFRKEATFPCTLNNTTFEFVETFNALRANIRFAATEKKYQKIVITSSIAGEGKSTVAINLAIAFAQNNNRVVLVDCDLRKPSLQKFLNIDNSALGLTTALAGLAKIEQCITHLTEMGIDVVTSGPVPPNPAELIGSAKLAEIIDTLAKEYEYILFDTPPVSLLTDAAVLAKVSDGVIFVVRHHFTKIGMALLAKTNLELVGATVIGSVLNDFRVSKSGISSSAYQCRQYQYGHK